MHVFMFTFMSIFIFLLMLMFMFININVDVAMDMYQTVAIVTAAIVSAVTFPEFFSIILRNSVQ